MVNTTADFPPVHIDVVDALAASVPPRSLARYPLWVRSPQTEAEFIAALVVHFRDGLVPDQMKGKPFAPMCDTAGYVTALPLKVTR